MADAEAGVSENEQTRQAKKTNFHGPSDIQCIAGLLSNPIRLQYPLAIPTCQRSAGGQPLQQSRLISLTIRSLSPKWAKPPASPRLPEITQVQPRAILNF
jgi:hypothetical protein